jgi:Double zinc ribbon
MNCVQCGEALAANAKFCRKCGCKVQSEPLSEALASPRSLPAAPVAAYATCPDCGALCKGQALFCKQCGCRFEESPGFQDTAPDWDTPLSPAEEKAILVFGNVQDSSEPASTLPGERIQTSAAMVIGGAAASSTCRCGRPMPLPGVPLPPPRTPACARVPARRCATPCPKPRCPPAATGCVLCWHCWAWW